jgi:methionyl-tRNA synthetase
LNNYKWNQFVEHIWHYIHKCNKYINDTEPWKQSNDAERLATILYNLVEHLRIISILVYPIIPGSSEQIAAQIGQPRGTIKNVKFTKKTTGMISEPKILFKKIETDKPSEPAHPPSDAFGALNLKVARVEKVEPHPNADKLYVVTLNAGNEQRTLVAGLKQYYTPEQLTGKHIVFISNLKPAQLRGVTSQGMMLAGEKNGTVKVLDASIAQPGEQVFVDGITPHTAQITIDDFMKIKLTTKNKHVVYGDKPLKTKSGIITVDLEDNATIR